MAALAGYCRALVKSSIPYVVVEEEHLEVLDGLKILFLPRIAVMSAEVEEALSAFVKTGGTLVCESECGAFSPAGLYRYPEDRFLARLHGCAEIGRRLLTGKTIEARLGDQSFTLGVKQWTTPWETIGGEKVPEQEGEAGLIREVAVGQGKLILCGCYLGDSYRETWTLDFEKFVQACVARVGWKPQVKIRTAGDGSTPFFYLKSGSSHGQRLLFVFFPPDAASVCLEFAPGFLPGRTATDLITGAKLAIEKDGSVETLSLPGSPWRFSVLWVEKD